MVLLNKNNGQFPSCSIFLSSEKILAPYLSYHLGQYFLHLKSLAFCYNQYHIFIFFSSSIHFFARPTSLIFCNQLLIYVLTPDIKVNLGFIGLLVTSLKDY
jgi:hypothetical protein